MVVYLARIIQQRPLVKDGNLLASQPSRQTGLHNVKLCLAASLTVPATYLCLISLV